RRILMSTQFDVAAFITQSAHHRNNIGLHDMTYKALCDKAQQHFEHYFDTEKNPDLGLKRLYQQHHAIIGDPSAKEMFITEIEEYLRTYNLTNVDFPQHFDTLAEGVYEDIFGWGPLAKFFK